MKYILCKLLIIILSLLIFIPPSNNVFANTYFGKEHSIPSSDNEIDNIYKILVGAIREKKQVVLIYNNYEREVCPHILGTKNGEQRVLVYQFAGGSKTGLPPQGGWRCLRLKKIKILEVKNGEWHTGDSHTQTQTCIDHVEVEVEY